MCAIISSPYFSFHCPKHGSGWEPVFEACLNESRVFSLPYSDCFPSVLPHWPQCRCCRRRLRWECHKWPETNVGLSQPADLQHSPKTFYFFFWFFFSISGCPLSLLFISCLHSFFKKSIPHHTPQYPFNSSCFPTSLFPLHLHLSCQIIWQLKLGSIFHLSTKANQWLKSCTTCDSL